MSEPLGHLGLAERNTYAGHINLKTGAVVDLTGQLTPEDDTDA